MCSYMQYTAAVSARHKANTFNNTMVLLSTHHGDTLKVYGQSLPGKHACAPKHVDILDSFAQLSLHLFICCQVSTYTYSACSL